MISLQSTPTTFLAPAFAANIERIPVPHPMSSTREFFSLLEFF